MRACISTPVVIYLHLGRVSISKRSWANFIADISSEMTTDLYQQRERFVDLRTVPTNKL